MDSSVSGQEARKFRKGLAWRCDSPADVFQTLKFKLDCGPAVDFSKARRFYETLEGTGRGSLTYLLFTLIVSGFRIFAKAQGAKTFLAATAYKDNEFSEAVSRELGFSLPEFKPSKLAILNAEIPRKVKIFDAESIKARYLEKFAGKNSPVEVEDLFGEIADALNQNFSSWTDVGAEPVKAAGVIDSVLRKRGIFPSLKAMFSNAVNLVPQNPLLGTSTIAFDPARLVASPDEELNPYVAVASILRDYVEGDEAKFVQNNLITATNSGLSWFLNKGLHLLATLPVQAEGTDSLQALFGVPEDKLSSLAALKDAAEAVEQNDFLFENKKPLGLDRFRSVFGGHIDSWVANYLNRLSELQDLLGKIPEELGIPKEFSREGGESLLEFAGLNKEDVEATVAKYMAVRGRALESLAVLRGRADKLPAKEDLESVETLSALINRLYSIRNSVDNCLEQSKADNSNEWSDLDAGKISGWKAWAELKEIPKLNSLSGGVPQEEVELKQSLANLKTLANLQQADYQRVIGWARENNALRSFLSVAEEKEQEKLKKRPVEGAVAKELAVRALLNRVARLVRGRNDPVAERVLEWFSDNGIFRNGKDYNKFFRNSLGSLYVSPFSNRNHQAYDLGDGVVDNAESLFAGLFEEIKDQKKTTGLLSDGTETLLRLRQWVMNLELSSISKPIPSDVFKLSLSGDLRKSLSAEAELQLSLPRLSLSPSSFVKVFNTYGSLMSGCCIELRREKFYLRTKFSWIENLNLLCYSPKETFWDMPQRYASSDVWQPIIASGVLVWTEDGKVDVLKTFEKIHASKGVTENLLLLQQLPHDWMYVSPFSKDSGKAGKKIIALSKKSSKPHPQCKSVDPAKLMRLVGPSSYKTRLDQLLLEPEQVSCGDFTILIDQPVNQKLTGSNSGLTLDFETPVPSVAVPIKICRPTKAAATENLKPLFENIVAIDQGEAGLAYAVFRLEDFAKENPQPIANGAVRIPSIRCLIKDVGKYRKGRQSVSKFSQKYDSTAFNRRENVAGDVCHVIVGLMEKYNAFPVLERDVQNLESGSKQLSLVYKAVNDHFVYSSIAGRDAKRKQLWYGAGKWTIPGLEREFFVKAEEGTDENTEGKTTWKALEVWPGATVSAQFTSKICSCCHRNIGELMKKAAKDAACRKLTVNEGGTVSLYGETLELFTSATNEEARKYRRRNERAPLSKLLRKGEIQFADFKKPYEREFLSPH